MSKLEEICNWCVDIFGQDTYTKDEKKWTFMIEHSPVYTKQKDYRFTCKVNELNCDDLDKYVSIVFCFNDVEYFTLFKLTWG